MIYDIHCPFCKNKFKADEFGDEYQCPNCKEEFYFDERCTEDYSDCWTSVEWYTLDKFWPLQ